MRSSILLPRLEAAGARIAPRPEAPGLLAVLTTGDVPAEYRAGRDGCLLLDATDRGLVRVGGVESRDFLHRILSNRVRDLQPGEGTRNLLLSPKGKVRFDVDAAADEDEVRLSAPPGTAEALRAAIDAFLFGEDVRLDDATDTHAPLEVAGPGAREVVARTLGIAPPCPPRTWRRCTWNGTAVEVTALAVAGRGGFRLDAGPACAPALWEALESEGAVPAGIVARDILRVETCTALFGVDVDENVYPQEARLEDAFSLHKGCYTGQEVVAKIDTYGGLNKRLLPLRIDHDDPVARGTRLLGGDEGGEPRELGLVTSWAYSFALDSGMVLAFVKRKHQETGTAFSLAEGAGTATIVDVPQG